jgi:hypothetical protein
VEIRFARSGSLVYVLLEDGLVMQSEARPPRGTALGADEFSRLLQSQYGDSAASAFAPSPAVLLLEKQPLPASPAKARLVAAKVSPECHHVVDSLACPGLQKAGCWRLRQQRRKRGALGGRQAGRDGGCGWTQENPARQRCQRGCRSHAVRGPLCVRHRGLRHLQVLSGQGAPPAWRRPPNHPPPLPCGSPGSAGRTSSGSRA